MKAKLLFFSALIFSMTVLGQQVQRASKLFVQNGLQFHTWANTGAHEWPANVSPGYETYRSTVLPNQNVARYVRIQLPGDSNEILSLAEVRVWSGGVIRSLSKVATQSTTDVAVASRAVDGNLNGDYFNGSVTATLASAQPWWQVDLGANYAIDNIEVFNRTDCCTTRLRGYHILVSPNPIVSDGLEDAINEPGVVVVGPSVAIGNEYTNLPFVQDYYEKPGYNYSFFNSHPNAKWGIEKGPFGDHLTFGPTADQLANGFLNTDQLGKLSNLVTIGLGDEDNYSSSLLTWTTDWFNLSRSKYPNVMLHNNQYVNQWSDANMRTYIQTAKPDFISFDNYLFSQTTPGFAGGTLKPMYDYLGRYRRLALEGLDGTGASPIEFGQYLIGFKQGANQYDEGGLYYSSESQIYGEIFGSLTMGAKWVSAWRYTRDASSKFWIDSSGNPMAAYYWYAKGLREFANLSPYLSRLRTTDVRVVLGQYKNGTTTTTNPRSTETPLWTSGAGSYITSITATNLVPATNSGLRGDVLVGYFKSVPNLATDTDVNLGPLPNQKTKFFMIMNGLTKANGCCNADGTPAFATDTIAGKANKATQKIRLAIDFGTLPVDVLKRVNRSTGAEETVSLTLVSGKKYTVDITLDGGKADLFYWQNELTNLALYQPATQSSTSGSYVASKSVDGDTSGILYPNLQGSSTNQESQPWWQVDLGAIANLTDVKLYNRTDCCANRLTNYYIFVSDVPFTSNTVAGTLAQSGVRSFLNTGQAGSPSVKTVGGTGRYVRIQLNSTSQILNMGEVEVYGYFNPAGGFNKLAANFKKLAVDKVDLDTNRLNIYPNPLKNGVPLKLDFVTDSPEDGVTISLSNMTGQVMWSHKVNIIKGVNKMEFSMEGLSQGIYLIDLAGHNLKITKKIIVVN